MTIEGATLLEGRIAYAGDWHDTFLHTVQTGRKHGIRLYGGSINFGLLILSMRKAGFTTLQARLIKDNIHPAAEHPEQEEQEAEHGLPDEGLQAQDVGAGRGGAVDAVR